MTVMVQPHVTVINVVIILPQSKTSTVVANVISSGKDLAAKSTMPHATQSVLAVTAAQHAIANSVWSTPMLKTILAYVTISGVERIAHSGKAHATLTACNLTIVMDQKTVTVTTAQIMPNSMNATTVFV